MAPTQQPTKATTAALPPWRRNKKNLQKKDASTKQEVEPQRTADEAKVPQLQEVKVPVWPQPRKPQEATSKKDRSSPQAAAAEALFLSDGETTLGDRSDASPQSSPEATGRVPTEGEPTSATSPSSASPPPGLEAAPAPSSTQARSLDEPFASVLAAASNTTERTALKKLNNDAKLFVPMAARTKLNASASVYAWAPMRQLTPPAAHASPAVQTPTPSPLAPSAAPYSAAAPPGLPAPPLAATPPPVATSPLMAPPPGLSAPLNKQAAAFVPRFMKEQAAANSNAAASVSPEASSH